MKLYLNRPVMQYLFLSFFWLQGFGGSTKKLWTKNQQNFHFLRKDSKKEGISPWTHEICKFLRKKWQTSWSHSMVSRETLITNIIGRQAYIFNRLLFYYLHECSNANCWLIYCRIWCSCYLYGCKESSRKLALLDCNWCSLSLFIF